MLFLRLGAFANLLGGSHDQRGAPTRNREMRRPEAIEISHKIVVAIENMIAEATSPPIYGDREDHAKNLMDALVKALTE